MGLLLLHPSVGYDDVMSRDLTEVRKYTGLSHGNIHTPHTHTPTYR